MDSDDSPTENRKHGAPRIYIDTSTVSSRNDPDLLHLSTSRDSTKLGVDSRADQKPVNASASRSSSMADGCGIPLPSRSPALSSGTAFSSTPTMGHPRTDDDILAPHYNDAHLFRVATNNPFAFTPGHLCRLINPKNLDVLDALGGLAGLERGLRTDTRAGLSLDETGLSGSISFEDATSPETPIKCNPELTDAAIERGAFADRQRVFGRNVLPERKTKSFWRLVWEAMQDKVLILLSVAAVVSFSLGMYQTFRPHGVEEEHDKKVEWVEGVAIIVAVAIVALVGSINDWQKERQFAKLNRKKEDRLVKVVRSGRPAEISIFDLLVGDVMKVEQGDIIPVDGILIEGHNVSCDEASATGESDLVKKIPAEQALQAVRSGESSSIKGHDPFILSGAKVLDGIGSCLVTAVGGNSSYGQTMLSLQDAGDMTPLQFKLHKLAGYIAILGGMAGILLFLVLFIEFLARITDPGSAAEKGQQFMRIFITAITIIVVAVPEGLPLAVTLALAFATKRMTKENNLVRHLQSCETMGNATVICSDKTGTLTENVMTVVAGSMAAGYLRFGDGKDSEAGRTVSIGNLAQELVPETRALLKDAIALNTTAFETKENGNTTFIGTKTETALLDWARDCFGLRDLDVERANHVVKEVYPFNSRRKCMGTVIKLPCREGQVPMLRLFVKGAPEILLENCTLMLEQEEGGKQNFRGIHHADQLQIEKIISGFASRSLRTLGLCYRDVPESSWSADGTVEFEDIFQGMCWIGVVGIQDPVRKGVPAAVQDCRRAGVDVKMVTGDNVETARAIAKECGLLTSDTDIVMEGADFRRLSDDARVAMVSNLKVLARSSPEDKRVLVKALQSTHNIVAVTGDGTNDAPALKAADVGFSMGITGTEVAKEASDIILMDDNFSSIVKALAWGRAINDSVKKFLQFQITVNITAVFLTFITAVSSDQEKSVLNAVQLLWVNLIMDTFAALALATDPPNGSLLDRKPEPKTAPLINLTMWKMIIGQSIYQLTVTLVLYYAGPYFLHYPDDELRTLIFNTFVFMQIFKLVNSRRIDNKLNILEGLHRNHLFIGIGLVMFIGQVLIVFVGDNVFEVHSLNGAQWGISLVLGLLSIPVGILIRLFPDKAFEKLCWPFLLLIHYIVAIFAMVWRLVKRPFSKGKDTNRRRSITSLEAGLAGMTQHPPGIGGSNLDAAMPKIYLNSRALELKNDLDKNLAWWTFRGGRMKHYEEKLKRALKWEQQEPIPWAAPYVAPALLAASIGTRAELGEGEGQTPEKQWRRR